MGKKHFYIIEKNVNKIIRGDSTNFLDPSTLKNVCNKLKGYNYNIYYPYSDSDKVKIGFFSRIKTYFNSIYEITHVTKNMNMLNTKFISIF